MPRPNTPMPPVSAAAAPHAPEVGWARRVLGRFHVTGVFWFRLHRAGIALLPSWALAPVIQLFTAFFFLTLLRIRGAIASNLEAVLGPAPWWRRQIWIHRTFWNFAWCLTERYERLSTDRRVEAVVDGLEHWRATESKGLILATAHLGHWEVGSSIASENDTRTVHVVREEEMDPRAQDFIRELFERRGERRLRFHFAAADPSFATRLLGYLRGGEIVALQSDRPRTGGRTLPVELFGKPFEIPAGLVAMARLGEAPILPVFVFREGRQRSRIVFRPPIQIEPTGDRRRDDAEAARRLAEGIEWAIRQRPHQWFCFRQLWPEAP